MQPEGEQNYWQQGEESRAAVPQAFADAQPHVLEPLEWQASEAVHYEKNFLWFAGLGVITLILLAVSIFLIRSWTFAALVVVMAVAVVILASRPPRVVHYHLDAHKIQINDKAFSLHDFRAFGVVEDGPLYSLVLIPNKRFMPAVTVYFPAEQGEYIVDLFGSSLPMEHVELDFIDKLTRAARF